MALIESCQLAHQVTPSAAAGVSLTPNGTPWADSAWVELEDSTPDAWIVTGVVVGSPGWTDPCHVELGVGAAGAESPIATIPAMMGYNTNAITGWLRLPIPMTVAAGQRIAVRLRKLDSATDAWKFALTYYTGAPPATLTTTTQPLLALPASQISVNTLGVGATPTIWSAWVELSSGLSTDIALGWLTGNSTGGPNGWYEVQIGTGPAGNESPIATLSDFGSTGSNPGSPSRLLLRPLIRIASGRRIAARARQLDFTFARDYSVGLAYYEVPL